MYKLIKYFKIYLLILFVVLFLFFFFKESKIEPIPFFPPEKIPLILEYKPNEFLLESKILAEGKLKGPEAISFDKFGNLYTGTKDGKLFKISKEGFIEEYSSNLGRPLGLKVDEEGQIYIADAYKGLLKIDKNKKIEILVPFSEEFKLIDDLVLTKERIYFSNASKKFTVDEYLYDLLEGIGTGSVYEYDLKTKQIKELISKLRFANGIAISKNQDFLVINETYKYRILKYYLSGNKKGSIEYFKENVPGFPDNITSNGKGEFCLALYTIRNPLLDLIQPFPVITKQYSKLPKLLWPKPKPYGFIVILDEAGNVLKTYQDTHGKRAKGITSCIEFDNTYYIGFLHEEKILQLNK